MPNNSIALASKYVPMLDEVYKLAALSSDLDGASELARQGANADEMIIPKISMDGLADYGRNSGYVDGDVTMVNETVKCNFDRGRMFTVDNMDNVETAGLAFGRLAGEFIRTKVVPELDAFRFAMYASAAGISKASPATLADGAAVIAALRAAVTQMDEDEVPLDQRYLFITPTLHGYVKDLDTNKSREVFDGFAKVVDVPQTRFYTKILQKDGKTEGQTGGGYVKAEHSQEFTGDGTTTSFTVTGKPAELQKVIVDGTAVTTGFTYTSATGALVFSSAPANTKIIKVIYDTGVEINFLIVHKPAVIQFQKHVAPKIVTPEANQSADAYKFGYRNVGIADVYDNKLAGIYLHCKAI
ncbi:MAG: hypothetical protein IKO68_00120 [Oscillospiraceae bacterium]|nr:hypothetical protein [Oscillospiraceae bacterium]MBR4655000.1 hypothetical protein [Oscillospiraceae bacterium]